MGSPIALLTKPNTDQYKIRIPIALKELMVKKDKKEKKGCNMSPIDKIATKDVVGIKEASIWDYIPIVNLFKNRNPVASGWGNTGPSQKIKKMRSGGLGAPATNKQFDVEKDYGSVRGY